MLKKLLLVLMACVMLFSCAACGNNNEPQETVTLKWLVPGDEQPDTAKVLEEVNKILEPEIGVKLDLQFIATGSYSEKMKMDMAAGGDFDLCFTANWLNTYVTGARNGGFYDVTDLIDKELRATMDDKVWEASKVDGKIYAVPNNQVMFSQLAVGVRKDLAEKYNLDLGAIKHIEDIEPFLETIKNNEEGVYPYNASTFVSPWVNDYVGKVNPAQWIGYRYDTNEVVIYNDQPEVQAAMAKLREWYKKGYIRSDFASAGGDTNATDINQGKYAVKIETWKPGMDYFDAEGNVPYVWQPIGKTLFGTPTATMTAISATCKYPEKAMELIKVMNTNKEVYNLICYGIEGTHYTLDAENKVVLTEPSGYVPQGDWKFGSQFNAMLSAGMDDNVWEETERLNREAIATPISDFTFNSSTVRVENSQVAATNVEYSFTTWLTAKDSDTFLAQRTKAMEASGSKTVFEEAKKQIQEHTANK